MTAVTYDARGKALGSFYVPGGQPPKGTVKVVLSDTDYEDMQRHMAGRKG